MNKIFQKKIHSKFLKALRVELKACLGILLIQYCPIIVWEIEAGFWVMLFGVPTPLSSLL